MGICFEVKGSPDEFGIHVNNGNGAFLLSLIGRSVVDDEWIGTLSAEEVERIVTALISFLGGDEQCDRADWLLARYLHAFSGLWAVMLMTGAHMTYG